LSAIEKCGASLPISSDHPSKRFSASSRTDKGVHSLATLFSGKIKYRWRGKAVKVGNVWERVYDTREQCVWFRRKMNDVLPPDIRVIALKEAPRHFKARRGVVGRKVLQNVFLN